MATQGFQSLMKQTKSLKALNEIILSIEFEVPWIIYWNFKCHKVHPNETFVSIVREFKFKFWRKFNFDKNCNLHQISRYLKMQSKQAIDTSSTRVKKDDKHSSPSSSKGSK